MTIQKCQLHSLEEIPECAGLVGLIEQRARRVKRIMKRRISYLQKTLRRIMRDGQNPRTALVDGTNFTLLQAGDFVRVKSAQEIRSTLNNWNGLRGCAFMEEMVKYCGTTQRVLKRVDKFLHERDYLMRKCNHIVLLENVYCEGTRDFGKCDRSCLYFWREEWLERIE
jgi:hypothetical protein